MRQLEDGPAQREVRPGVVVRLEEPGEYNSEEVKAQVMANVQTAMAKQHNLVSPVLYLCTSVEPSPPSQHKGYSEQIASKQVAPDLEEEPGGLQETCESILSHFETKTSGFCLDQQFCSGPNCPFSRGKACAFSE